MLSLIESAPNNVGVAQSFLAVEQDLKTVYGKWCAVADRIQKETGRGNMTIKHDRDIKNGNSSKLSEGLRRSLSSGKIHSGGPRLSMSDVVIMPVQRITRYHLFMKGKVVFYQSLDGFEF